MSKSIDMSFQDGELFVEPGIELTEEQWQQISRFALRKYFSAVVARQNDEKVYRTQEFGE